MKATIDETLEWLAGIDTQSIKWELTKARAVKAWAMTKSGIDFEVGDRVEFITAPSVEGSGWFHYRECLVVGATATVDEIDFNAHYSYWYASIRLDREWSVSDYPPPDGTRYWNGPAVDTPDGMKPPHDPAGRIHTFAMPVRHLRKVCS